MRTQFLSLCLCAVVWGGWLVPSSHASEARETPLVRAVKKAKVAVVNIHTEKLEKTAHEREGGFPAVPPKRINGMGTGIIVDERGYIVTNQHVVADVESMSCTLSDGSTHTARVISFDRKHDLAIIKINASRPLPTMPLGTSSDLMLGETVVAIGNAFGYTDTVTSGIVSSLSRDVEVNETQSYKNLIQTDASINPGNSGGPLINLDGDVVGINVAIRAGAQRIGFTIPIDDARRYIARLMNIERLGETYHGVVSHDEKRPDSFKMIVDSVEANSPGAAAGLQTGDIILQVAAIKVNDGADFERALLGQDVGAAVDIKVKRGEQDVDLKLAVAKTPANLARNRPNAPVNRGQNEESLEELIWRTVGLKVTKAGPQQFAASNSRYRGGLQVSEVRPDSPAVASGIRPGDVLVGLHEWETIKPEDIRFILTHQQVASNEQVRFFLIRGQEVLQGNLKVVSALRVADTPKPVVK
jgi:serine protease Do